MNGTGGVQVLGRTLSNGSRLWLRWLRRRLPSLRVTGCFLSVAFASAVIPGIEKWDPANNLLWVANGLLLAYLLVAPRWRWPAYLFAGFLALFIRALIFPAQWNVILLYNLLDLIEVGAAPASSLRGASLLHRALLFHPLSWIRGVACASPGRRGLCHNAAILEG
jgi:hypothetical protein